MLVSFMLLCLLKTISARVLLIGFTPGPSNAANVFEVQTNASSPNKLHCAALCSMNSRCLSFNHDSAASLCRMSNKEPGGFGSGAVSFSYGYRARSAAYQKCRYLELNSNNQLMCPIQQRQNDKVTFQQTWLAYVNGFGDADNIWIGLQSIHEFTSAGTNGATLTVDHYTWSGELVHLEYSNFLVLNASTKYYMTYNGIVPSKSSHIYDYLTTSNGTRFSTMDADNDNWAWSCSNYYHGNAGWWFNACTFVNPNGVYSYEVRDNGSYMFWRHPVTVRINTPLMRLMLTV